MDTLIENWKKTKTAVYDFEADDEIQHTIWVVNDESTIQEISSIFQNEIPCTYIADGHHRAASAAKVRAAFAHRIAPASHAKRARAGASKIYG